MGTKISEDGGTSVICGLTRLSDSVTVVCAKKLLICEDSVLPLV